MATGSWPNLLDVASRMDASGGFPRVAQLLSQKLSVYKAVPFIKANERTSHMFVIQTSIPTGFFRQYNVGVPASKGTTAKGRVSMGMLTDYSVIDRALAEHTGNPEKFRKSEDIAFLEGMGQTMEQTFIYGNEATNPAAFDGLATYYNTINTAKAQNAANVINGGGTGTSNTSIWMVGFGPNTIHGIYPEGAVAGLKFEDKGDVRAAYDSLGNPYEAYTAYFEQQAGLVPKDWRYAARICNIDTTSAGLAGPNALDIFATIDEMLFMFPTLTAETSGITDTDDPEGDPGIRTEIFVNRTVMHWMQIQAMRNRNVLLNMKDYAGTPTPGYRDIPFKVSDQILNTESTLS